MILAPSVKNSRTHSIAADAPAKAMASGAAVHHARIYTPGRKAPMIGHAAGYPVREISFTIYWVRGASTVVATRANHFIGTGRGEDATGIQAPITSLHPSRFRARGPRDRRNALTRGLWRGSPRGRANSGASGRCADAGTGRRAD